jgi:sec-independent protein translocase protein TatC
MATDNVSVGETPEVEAVYPLTHHLKDLRKRVMYSGISVILMFCVWYAWQKKLVMDFVTGPLTPLFEVFPNASLTTLKLTEGFFAEMKLCFLAAMVTSMPVILYQFWRFVAPGLYKSERRYVVGFIFSATFLFIGGAAFAYHFVFPVGFKFFLSINAGYDMIATLSVEQYISFVVKLTIAFGLSFELPVIVFFLAKIGIVNAAMLRKYRKFAVLGIFVFAAVITPPDVISQLMMAFPMLLLYEISIFIAKIFGKKPEAVAADTTVDIYE